MQAMTIAIGKAGINFFAEQLIADELFKTLQVLTPPDRTIAIGHISVRYSSADNITISLTRGSLSGFAPRYSGVSQQADGNFTLVITADKFSANYNWMETYRWTDCYFVPLSGVMCDDPVNKINTYNYSVGIGQLQVRVGFQFTYDKAQNAWTLPVLPSSGTSSNVTANVPTGSIIQQQDQECFTSHVDDATATAISKIDFQTPINELIPKLFASIPGSGNLGDGIIYDFSLGDSGLLFPNNDGIQMGVKGGASYNGTPFSGDESPNLPLPVPPADADAHHLILYVSNYQVDALHWAFFKAGKLTAVVNPEDIPDPDSLKVKTYIAAEPSLKPYSAFAMQAQITPTAAPATAFQVVWEFTKDVMTVLQTQLPSDVYNLLNGLQGNAYTSQAALEQDLKAATIAPANFPTIENAAKSMGMVVTQNMNFNLIIQNGQPTPPNIQFSLARTDILTKLEMGMGANNTQTLQYEFRHATYNATFTSSTVPGFSGANFGNVVWPVAGEPYYDKVLADMGKTGVPLPIMQGFQFDFDHAQLSIQQGYISIEGNVIYKSA